MDKTIRVGTRQSALAIAQSRIIINQLNSIYPELKFELVGIKTKGDVFLDTKLDLIGGKGLFVNEIENALLQGSVDMAVHSMKDMPTEMPDELTIAAVSQREDPRDVLITTNGTTLDGLKEGAVIGTSSIRREIQLLNLRPDLKVKQLRGNVLTRLDKLTSGEYDAIILAAAGLVRLGLEEKCVQYFTVEEMIPAIGQGMLGVQIKKGEKLQEILESINCHSAFLQLEAERSFMLRLNGGCSTPIAAYATLDGDRMRIVGMLATTKSKEVLKATVEGDKLEARILGERLADTILVKQKALEDSI
jgi:hydroxymethylbilane synthase